MNLASIVISIAASVGLTCGIMSVRLAAMQRTLDAHQRDLDAKARDLDAKGRHLALHDQQLLRGNR